MLPFRFFGKLSFLCGRCWIKEILLRKQVENLFINKNPPDNLVDFYFLLHLVSKWKIV